MLVATVKLRGAAAMSKAVSFATPAPMRLAQLAAAR